MNKYNVTLPEGYKTSGIAAQNFRRLIGWPDEKWYVEEGKRSKQYILREDAHDFLEAVRNRKGERMDRYFLFLETVEEQPTFWRVRLTSNDSTQSWKKVNIIPFKRTAALFDPTIESL